MNAEDRWIAAGFLQGRMVLFVVLGVVLAACAGGLRAQDGTALPDAPQAAATGGSGQNAEQNGAQAAPGTPPPQTKRILGIIPNFRAVSADQKLPPQTVKDKFKDATEDSFDYSSVILPAAIAGYNQARDSVPEFGQGAAGYGRYFWHSLVDQTSENYMVEFIFPVATKEDSRYYTLGHGGFWKRTGYSLSRAVVTRNDAGNETFNISEVFGAGASAGLSNLYYPASQRGFSNTAQQWGLDVGIDAFTFALKEFWPDVNQKLFHGKQ